MEWNGGKSKLYKLKLRRIFSGIVSKGKYRLDSEAQRCLSLVDDADLLETGYDLWVHLVVSASQIVYIQSPNGGRDALIFSDKDAEVKRNT